MQMVVALPDGKRFAFTESGYLSRKAQLYIVRELIEKFQGEPTQR